MSMMQFEEKSESGTPAYRWWAMRVLMFYVNGFRGMSPLGRKLWILILIKLFIFFAVLKLFFFPDILSRDYDTDAERAQAVRTNLIK